MLTLFGNGGIDQVAVVDKLSQLKKEKQEYEVQANRLSKSIEQRIDINEARQKIDQYCKRVKANLDKCSLQGKKRALNALYVQVMAVPEKIIIRVAVEHGREPVPDYLVQPGPLTSCSFVEYRSDKRFQASVCGTSVRRNVGLRLQ